MSERKASEPHDEGLELERVVRLVGSERYPEQDHEGQCELHIVPGFVDARVQPALVKLFQPENVEQEAEGGIDKSFVFLVGELGEGEDALEEEDCFAERASGCVCDGD